MNNLGSGVHIKVHFVCIDRPVQKGNVSRPNIINHSLVTNHADAEVSGQTINTYLIKHRSNKGYKPLSKRGRRARSKDVRYGCPNEQNIARQTREQNVLSCLIECLIAFKFYQTQPNTIKNDQRAPNKVAKQ